MRIPRFKLERFFADYEFNVEHLLCGSDCESMSIAELLALEPGAETQFHSHWLGYTESNGSPLLREAICSLYETMVPSDILVHAGAEEAIFTLMNAVLESGDHIIVHSPCYQSLAEIARTIGCEVALWRAQEANEWALDLDELRNMICDRTKLIVVNLPHNPTGYLMSQSEFLQVSDIARDNDILLLCDEVYRESEYDPGDRLPAACDLGPHAISLGVMSKTYGLPGLRIGWLATRNADVLQRVVEMKDYTTICCSAPSEWLATLALRHRRLLVARNLEIIRSNLTLLDAFFEKHAEVFSWIRPKAGAIAFPKWLGGNIDDFTRVLVKEASVLLLPGSLFDDPNHHFRIGFGRQSFPEALSKLDLFLKKPV
ncbi:aminotransferase class I/II-fold pyridoxal phosphate-dependent enzyme [Candidatus Bipolaricaulota bacterium]|nr:aminotransferase class I/II-fold pyridoxal phosphate-dependent enzyme [Candidatus Bipolaricaulota bacterium]